MKKLLPSDPGKTLESIQIYNSNKTAHLPLPRADLLKYKDTENVKSCYSMDGICSNEHYSHFNLAE